MKKKFFFALVALLLNDYAMAQQDTIFYQYPRLRVPSLQQCDYYSLKTYSESTGLTKEVQYDKENNLMEQQHYLIAGKKVIKEGTWTTWYKNGNIESRIRYVNDKMNGLLETFWPSGSPKRVDSIANDEFISGKCLNEKGKEIKHFDYHIEPQFPGGAEALYSYLYSNIYFPQTYDPAEGKVVVRFLVRKNGSIDEVELMNNTRKFMAKQVIDAVKSMPRWNPGKLDGVPRDEFVLLPVTFLQR